jgi:ABC-type nitrate/sulfonate/bicarbonate transport system substrate-binding protein
LIVQRDIKSYDDLRGKTVVVDAPDTAYALLLYKMLEIKGLKKGDYVVKRRRVVSAIRGNGSG